MRTASQLLRDAREDLPSDATHLKVHEIVGFFHERGFGFLLFLFALPAALPLPGLGINLFIAAPLLFLTLQQAVGRHSIWLPSRVSERTISRERLAGFIDMAEPLLRRFEFLIAPRLGFVTQRPFSNLIGVCGVVMALCILVPLPLTNTVPAMGIALMALGVLMRDGLAVIAGMLTGLLWIALLVAVVMALGLEGIEAMTGFIKGMI